MNKYLEKISEVQLKPHQERAVAKVQKNPTLAVHSLGSGKTLTALYTVLEAKKKNPGLAVLVITPASLVANMWKEVDKHELNISKKDMTVLSYEKAGNMVEELSTQKWGAIIIDEAHRLRNKGTKRLSAIDKILKNSPNAMRLPLTGTPLFNKPEDIGVIINTMAGSKVMPDEARDFEEAFINIEKIQPGFISKHLLGVKDGDVRTLKNKKQLNDIFEKYVDYYDAKDDESYSSNFPRHTETEVEVEMNPEQQTMYAFHENKLPPHLKWKIRLGLPLSKKESGNLNAFSTGVRQTSNTPAPYLGDKLKVRENNKYSNKMRKIVADFTEAAEGEEGFKGVIYSNYMDAGLNPVKELLDRKGYKTDIYSGKLTAKAKKVLETRYNEGELDAILLSSSGAEGLDLKGTKMVQIMEPHFNKAKIDQVVGRAIRFKSHEHLPEEDRHVDVRKYLSTKKPGIMQKLFDTKDMGIDRYLSNVSNEKHKIHAQLQKIMKDSTYHSEVPDVADAT